MKIATYNVNGISARLPVLLRWLEETAPDVACLQELKAPQEKFPEEALKEAGYHAIWHGQKSWNGVAILARGEKPEEVGRGLAGDAEDIQSRYIEAKVNGVHIGCLYLPNGNPAPGPKFDYKLGWMERFTAHAAGLIKSGKKIVLTRRLQCDPHRSRCLQAGALGGRCALPPRNTRCLRKADSAGLDGCPPQDASR